jgi:hypothetical protein
MMIMHSRDRRALIWGAAVVAVGLIAGRGIPAVRRLYAIERADATRAERRLADARATIASAQARAESTGALGKRWTEIQDRSFNAPTANVLAADVASYISRLSKTLSVELTSIQVRPDSASAGGARAARGKVSARGDVRGVASLLAALESGRRLFRIQSLTITQGDPVAGPETPERLAVELSFSTVALEGARSTAVRGPPLDAGVAAATQSIIEANPFRLSRAPSNVAFGITPAARPTVAAAPRAIFNLTLRGIIGGPPWQALVEGIPGRDAATVVKSGDRYGELLFRAVRRDTVVVKSADSTWRLTLARAWR